MKVYLTDDLFKNTKPFDEFFLRNNVWSERKFDFARMIGSEFLMCFDVSRTWRPREALGSEDPRTLGIALGTPRFEDSAPVDFETPDRAEVRTPDEQEKALFRFEPSEREKEMGGKPPNIIRWSVDVSLPEGVF